MFSEALKIILKYQKDTTITIMTDPEVEMTRSFFVSHPDAFITGEMRMNLVIILPGQLVPAAVASCSLKIMPFIVLTLHWVCFLRADTRDAARDPLH